MEVSALLETLQHGTSATLGISRRSLLAAVSTAKILNVLKGSAGPNDAFTMLLDKYTSLGVYVIHHSFTLTELFAISGLQLVSNTLTAGIRTAEESVRVVDGLFGSTETSKALAAVVGLVKKEVYEDQDFAITQAGKMAVLASITKAITVFACLQAATHKQTQKSVRTMLVYEGVVVTRPKRLGIDDSTQLATIQRRQDDDEDENSGELLEDLSHALVTDPDDLTQDMTTTQIERVLSADILQVTTTTTLTTTTTQTFVRPGADLSKLGKPLPPIHDKEPSSSLQRQGHYPSSIETASSSRAASSSLAITTRSRRGSVSSIASVATTLTQYATTSIVSNHGTPNGTVRHSTATASDTFGPSESLATEGARQANNNLRLMFSTVTKKFKKNQKVQIGGDTDSTILSRTQEREIKTSEARDSLDWSEDDTDWIEVTKSSETMSSVEMNATLYDVPLEKKNGITKLGSGTFGLKNGLSTKKFGRSFFSKMTKPSVFGKNGEHNVLDAGPQLTITEVDESRNDSDNSLPDRNPASSPTLVELKGGSSDEDDHVDSRPPPPPKEPQEPNPANFPRDHLVRNIQRFMRYASASYGHNFMRILGIGTIGDSVYSPYGDHPNHHAFATHTSTPLDSILLSSFTDPGTKGTFHAPKMHSLVHYINLDHGAQCVVLTCRGTLGLSDVLTDLCAHYDDLVMPTVKYGKRVGQPAPSKYKVHAGMHASARLLSQETSTVYKTIKKALQDYPDYGLVLCGHSLGGGVAAILSLLWSMKSADFEAYVEEEEDYSSDDGEGEVTSRRGQSSPKQIRNRIIYPEITTPFVTSPGSGLPAGRPIHCYAFGPPCVMSLPLSRYCNGLITTVVHQYDLVPTLSLGLLRDFKNVATTLHEEGSVVEDIVKRLIIGASSNKANAERQAAEDARVASTTYTSAAAPGTQPTKSEGLPKRSQSMPMYSEYDRWQLQEAEDRDWSWSLIKTMRADMSSDKLYPPTPVYILESTATTVVNPEPSSAAAAAAASMAASVSMTTDPQYPGSTPMAKSFSASAAFSAAASYASGFRPSSPFGYRSSTPTPGASPTEATAPVTPVTAQKAFKVSMRRFDHVEDRFGELQFARSMFTDHNPANYEECVERLALAVFPEE
ncbi:hypothetical protein KI688_007377 [Linnemannia hyalina]|uniref:sn-1-specific diacylglycerol lipase n=1 Tax=Linnemannia hyalina TaxID=64524 RepID=A0A9P7XJQ4_9FUNG|nr:hypothetical protein KI688_007377 [Linnemannia hyalina]